MFIPGKLMYFTPEVLDFGVKYTFTLKSTVSGSDGGGPSAVHRSSAAAAMGRNPVALNTVNNR